MITDHRLAPLALSLVLVGCSTHDAPCTTCDVPVVYETEINDTAPQADWIGVLYPGEALSIRGHVSEYGYDTFDGFAFVTGAPMTIDLALYEDAYGADLDVCVWDPIFQDFVACFETAAHPETGQVVILEAGKEFHLVVRSFQGDSSYWLDVFGGAATYGLEALSVETEAREPGAWDAYGAAEAPARDDEELPGRAALILDVAEDGTLVAAHPARMLPLPGR